RVPVRHPGPSTRSTESCNDSSDTYGRLDDDDPEEGTKRERVERSYAQVSDSHLHTVALNGYDDFLGSRLSSGSGGVWPGVQ
ncbi:hypothetical protein, partial [Streptomyces lavendulae]